MLLLKKHPCVALIVAVLVFFRVPYLYNIWQTDSIILLWVKRLVGYLPLYFVAGVLAMHKKDAVIFDGEYKYRRVISLGSLIISLSIILVFTFGNIESGVVRLFTYQTLPLFLWLSLPTGALDKISIKFPLTIAPFLYGMHIVLKLILNSLWTQKLFLNVNFPLWLDIIFQFMLVGIMYGICLLVAFVLKKILPEKIYRILAGGNAGRKMF